MSRFGDSGIIYWTTGDTFAIDNTITLGPSQMPQYPFVQKRITDEKQYRTKTGDVFSYRNYNLKGFTFSWTNLDEETRGSLADMADSLPIFTFHSNANSFGTFRMKSNSFKDKEVFNEYYDVSFEAEEQP